MDIHSQAQYVKIMKKISECKTERKEKIENSNKKKDKKSHMSTSY